MNTGLQIQLISICKRPLFYSLINKPMDPSLSAVSTPRLIQSCNMSSTFSRVLVFSTVGHININSAILGIGARERETAANQELVRLSYLITQYSSPPGDICIVQGRCKTGANILNEIWLWILFLKTHLFSNTDKTK